MCLYFVFCFPGDARVAKLHKKEELLLQRGEHLTFSRPLAREMVYPEDNKKSPHKTKPGFHRDRGRPNF